MNEIKVSIVLPSKNVKDYIKECLESVINQTLRDIEIICVDANSTDGTREIIEEYKNDDNRIILLDDDMGSCGYAYNIGIAISRGKYVGFVETDDYVRLDMFERLYNVAEANNLDYVKGNHTNFTDVGNERFFEEERVFRESPYERNYGLIINPSMYPEVNWFDHCMWNGIYRREYLKDKNVKLNESKGPSYQDHGFQWQTILKARKAMYLDESYYFYRNDNANSSMNNLNGIVKDYGEFLFVRNILNNSSETMSEHWSIYYDKMFYTLKRWVELYVKNDFELSGEQKQVIEKWIYDLHAGEAYITPKMIGMEKYCELALLKDNFELYCEYVKSIILAKDNYLKSIIKNMRGKSVIIFGAGVFGTRICAVLEQFEDIKIIAFCDNKAHENQLIRGKDVYTPDYAINKYGDAYYLIANQKYYLDCMRQLMDLGVDKSHISYYEMTNNELDGRYVGQIL
ncbi:Glycosyl transferase family 2 [Pseudobutyrivibrio sp. YE44]|uniref:glycosyltransferase n=1 Tax=Pseudobutyrivibrio sp. YE44 TaxID=1520802 RepID=UPI00088A2758|nr:glycosyltransferase [Pseudobutyrivibrio sp. YE44]SDB28942.1 Glycosyl transferase family 2 [Pseudobutyrivibrio sp. YE44]